MSLGFSSKVQSLYRLGNPKAAAHVAVDLQCWFTVKLIWSNPFNISIVADVVRKKGISRDKVALASEEIKRVAKAIIELCLSEHISKSVSQSKFG